MDTIISDKNFEMKLDKGLRLMVMKFRGDIEDENYKQFWEDCFSHARQYQVNRVIVDQSLVGNISFNARGWVAVKMFPKIKKFLPKDLAGGIISSSKLAHKSGVQYLVKTFRALTGYRVEFFEQEKEAVEWLVQLPSLEKTVKD